VPKKQKELNNGGGTSSTNSVASYPKNESSLSDLHNRSQSLKTLSMDPLSEAVNIARTANATSSFTDMLTNTSNATSATTATTTAIINNTQKKRKKEKAPTSMVFTDTEGSEDEVDEANVKMDATQTQQGTIQLSELPQQQQNSKAQIAQTQLPSEAQPTKTPKVPVYSNMKATDYNQMKYGKKRNPFTDSEKAAIKKGVEKFGIGQWSSVKSHYAIILRDRNTTQLKDAFRTMRRKGEIDESAIPNTKIK